ncbi:MAG: hypothetical protein KJO54_13700 [Gammaproteobacteria bacterium]|nr:hypothetical protein [Gammaproteobacteria bacterium]NNF59881.1 hypothetical protein [Gammaproteobacteria bacterium]NNM21478.1 hypothetical protein [Gammaproteobacteria bacterium]
MKTALAGVLLLALGTTVPGATGIATTMASQGVKARPVVTSPGKRTAAVTMQHKFDRVPAAGEPLVVTMEFTAGIGEVTRVEVGAATALGLDRRVLRRVRAAEPVELSLLPQRDGRHYLSVVAQLDSKQVRVFQVPVQVGSGKTATPATRAKAVAGADGELVVILPASEK